MSSKNCDGLWVAIFLEKGNSVGHSDVRFLITNIGIMQLIVAAYGLSIRQFFTKGKVQSDSFLYENKKRTYKIKMKWNAILKFLYNNKKTNK